MFSPWEYTAYMYAESDVGERFRHQSYWIIKFLDCFNNLKRIFIQYFVYIWLFRIRLEFTISALFLLREYIVYQYGALTDRAIVAAL